LKKNTKKEQKEPLVLSEAAMAVQGRLELVKKKSRNMQMKQKFPSLKFSVPGQDSKLKRHISVQRTTTSEHKNKVNTTLELSRLDLEGCRTKPCKQLNPSLIYYMILFFSLSEDLDTSTFFLKKKKMGTA